MYVIEVKNWSREFLESEAYFDPFDQVGRARFLCQCLLRDRGYEVTVRDIIAFRGSIPRKPERSYTKVIPVRRLSEHIVSHKERKFERHVVNGMKLCLE